MGKSLLFLFVGIGVLIAPDKGSNTLNSLLNKAGNLKDDTEDYLSETADKIKGKMNKVKDAAEE